MKKITLIGLVVLAMAVLAGCGTSVNIKPEESMSGKKIITLAEYAKNNKLSHSNLINKANRQTIEAFLRKGSLKTFEKQAGEVFFYHSEDDFAVPFSHLTKYQKELSNATIRAMKDRNHFLQENIPELIIDIKK